MNQLSGSLRSKRARVAHSLLPGKATLHDKGAQRVFAGVYLAVLSTMDSGLIPGTVLWWVLLGRTHGLNLHRIFPHPPLSTSVLPSKVPFSTVDRGPSTEPLRKGRRKKKVLFKSFKGLHVTIWVNHMHTLPQTPSFHFNI